jgi:hypothetical protein
MPSNDEVVWGIPSIQCPSCGQVLDVSGKKMGKFTKQQRKDMEQGENTYSTAGSNQRDPFPNGEETRSQQAEKALVVVSCENFRCEQYNKIKVLELPRIKTPSIKVDLA